MEFVALGLFLLLVVSMTARQARLRYFAACAGEADERGTGTRDHHDSSNSSGIFHS